MHLGEESKELLVKVTYQVAKGDVKLLGVGSRGDFLNQGLLEALLELGGVNLFQCLNPVLVVLRLEVVQDTHELVENLLSLHRLAGGNEVLGILQHSPGLLNHDRKGAGPEGSSSVLGFIRAKRRRLALLIELGANGLALLNEEGVNVRRFLLYAALNTEPLGKRIKDFQKDDSSRNLRNPVERRGDDIRVHDLEVLDTILKEVVVIVPTGSLDVKDLIIELAKALDLSFEGCLNVEEGLRYLRAFGSSELRQRATLSLGRGRLASKLNLPFTHFEEVAAALDEGVDLREN
mmetsp:Transcript_23508/g.48945  ORF Transcript_23508/g.48945 Transcript_23508/m.48945 type:complete len:291 (+) Transcript_23508:11525-12397(+)